MNKLEGRIPLSKQISISSSFPGLLMSARAIRAVLTVALPRRQPLLSSWILSCPNPIFQP